MCITAEASLMGPLEGPMIRSDDDECLELVEAAAVSKLSLERLHSETLSRMFFSSLDLTPEENYYREGSINTHGNNYHYAYFNRKGSSLKYIHKGYY